MTAKKAAKAVRARTVASKGGKAVKESKQSTTRRKNEVSSMAEIADAIRSTAEKQRAAKKSAQEVIDLVNKGRVARGAKPIPKNIKEEKYHSQEDQPDSKDPIGNIVKRALKPMKIPAKMGAVADDLYNTRAQRLALSKVVAKLEAHESALKNYVIDNLSKDSATGAAGKVARVQIKTVESPVVENWDKFYANIKKKGEFELLNRALNKKAVAERWNNGKTVPGVGKYTDKKVSVTKV